MTTPTTSFPDDKATKWQVGRAIAIELSVAIWLVTQQDELSMLRDLLGSLRAGMDATLLDDVPDFFGSARVGLDTFLSDLAELAGVLNEGDYSRATLAMRQLTPEAALATLGQTAAEADMEHTMTEQLAAALLARTMTRYRALGLESSEPETLKRRTAAKAERLVRVMAGGDLHARFWHWLDRFYYEAYGPWRQTREAFLRAEEARAQAALGALRGAGVPSLEWLSPQNPLRNRSGIRAALEAGNIGVFFLVEPFGLVDLVEADADRVYVTFGEPGEQYERFREMAEDVARRAKALADPTRLIILRLIRNFGMDNTEMAEFLEIARPTVSVHAKILREAGLIESRQVGRQARHEIDSNAVRRLFQDLERFLDLPEGE
jgi:DNA-binding transcriptional ArsR family regulator